MIVFVHLLNDRSGSPAILKQAIATLSKVGDGSLLFIGSEGTGCLDETFITVQRYWYRRTQNRLFTFLSYFLSQILLFIKLIRCRDISKDAVIYVNTLLPFGAAIYGKLTQRRVIYHLHEVSIKPALIRHFLLVVSKFTASHLIYVSNFHRKSLSVRGVHSQVIYNALTQDFLASSANSIYQYRNDGCFNILMLASLRDYKGVPELVSLAKSLTSRTDIQFDLVVNDDEVAIQHYFRSIPLPSNLKVHPRTNNPSAYYSKASLVLNLSRTNQWIETFGLTLLEAMAFGIPVIAPPVGGPLEIVSDGFEGYLIDSRDINKLAEVVLKLADNETLCLRISNAARRKAGHFSPYSFSEALRGVLAFDNVRKHH